MDSPLTNSINSVNLPRGLATPASPQQVFARHMARLAQAFPTFQLDPAFAWEMLGDLPDALLERAVLVLIHTKIEAYPGTNWVAVIRTTALDQRSMADELTPSQRQRLRELRGD